jgi:ABC-type amino acid transport substrate-binding protein
MMSRPHALILAARTILFALFALSFSLSASAQPEQQLLVGTRIAPPFVTQEDSGEYSGISVELWDQVAQQLNLDYQLVETELANLITGLEDGSLDASVAALTVTADREETVDFSHPFHTTGLAIAVPNRGNPVWGALQRLFSWDFLAALAALTGLLLLVGVLLWLVERKKNKEMFGGSTAEGVGASFWWAAVTMTTVGYGDKAPVTLPGRIIAMVWMFAAIILISGFTAAIATSLTVNQLESSVTGPEDLPGVRVATVNNSVSAGYLANQGISFAGSDDLQALLTGLAEGQYDAVIYDRPLLQYLVNQEFPRRTNILPGIFERQDYAIALPDGSTLREPLNQALLQIIASDQWQGVLTRYLGDG